MNTDKQSRFNPCSSVFIGVHRWPNSFGATALFAAFPIRETAGGGWSARCVELLFESLDVGLEKFAQFGNLYRQVFARDLVLLQRGLGGPAGGPAGGRSGGLHMVGDGRGDAFVGGAP